MALMPSIRIAEDARAEDGLPQLLLKHLVAVKPGNIFHPFIPGLLEVVVGDFPVYPAAVVLGRKEFGGKVPLQVPICKVTVLAGAPCGQRLVLPK